MSTLATNPRVEAAFRKILLLRWWIVGGYGLMVPGALLLSLGIPKDSAVERMVVASNPAVAATREFQRVLPDAPVAVLLVEAEDPLSEPTLAAVLALQKAADRVPKVTTYSVLTVWERMRPGAARPEAGEELLRLVSGTTFFRDQE